MVVAVAPVVAVADLAVAVADLVAAVVAVADSVVVTEDPAAVAAVVPEAVNADVHQPKNRLPFISTRFGPRRSAPSHRKGQAPTSLPRFR